MRHTGITAPRRGLPGPRRIVRRLKKEFRYHAAWSKLRIRAARQGLTRDKLERARVFCRTLYLGVPATERDSLQNPFGGYFPGLGAKPIYDPHQFDWTERLEAAFPEIQREALAMLESQAVQPHPQKLTDAGSWLTSYFYVRGEPLEATHRACPATSAALKSCFPDGVSEQAFFSVLSGGAHVKPHCGPWNTRLTCHLGLVVPEGASMRVGTQTVEWHEGKCLIFDDSFEHEVVNKGDARRVVLLLHMWHPDLTTEEVWAVRELMQIQGEGKYEQAVKRGKTVEDLDRRGPPAD
jgi:aspartyl/asparaginyl beta-hydroxylase (cupin superfamily)